MANVTSYLCARFGAMRRSVSQLIIVLSQNDPLLHIAFNSVVRKISIQYINHQCKTARSRARPLNVILTEQGFFPSKKVVKLHVTMAKAIVTAEKRDDTHPQAMVHRIAQN